MLIVPSLQAYTWHTCIHYRYQSLLPYSSFLCIQLYYILLSSWIAYNVLHCRPLYQYHVHSGWTIQPGQTMHITLAAFFKSFRKGFVVCRGLDANLSGKVAKKKRLWHGKAVATPTMCSSPSYRCVRNLSRCHRARLTLLPRRIYT